MRTTEEVPAVKHLRSLALGANWLGAHAVIWAVAAHLGAAIAAVEVVLAVTVILTALFGPDRFSDRAFRLLRRESPRRASE
jgi:hypothetical protein